MSWYTPTFSGHRRDIHYTFELNNEQQETNNSGKKRQNSVTQVKKRKIENKPSGTKQTPKQKQTPKLKQTTVKVKPKKPVLKKTSKTSASIDKDTFI